MGYRQDGIQPHVFFGLRNQKFPKISLICLMPEMPNVIWARDLSISTAFLNAQDALALSKWMADTEKVLQKLSFAVLKNELSTAGLKASRKKEDAVQALLRKRFRESGSKCLCCKD